MAGEPIMTIVGNLTADPELRFTPNGAAVANFTVAVTPRTLVNEEWTDGETTWFRCAVWREYAENVAESLVKGMRVIVSGRFKTRPWQDNDGNERLSVELDVDEVGPSLRFGTTGPFTKTQGGSGGQSQQRQQPNRQQSRGGQQQRGQAAPQSRQQRGGQQQRNDPWSGGGNADPWAGQGQPEEPPY